MRRRFSRPAVAGLLSAAVLVLAAGGAAAVELADTEEPTAATVEQSSSLPHPLVVTEPLPGPETEAEAVADPLDPATCLPQPQAPSTSSTSGSTGETAVSFVLPASTWVHVDATGTPVAVSTNTGQAPCVTDVFLRAGVDGAVTPADAALRDAALSAPPAGAWQPGVPQPLPAPLSP